MKRTILFIVILMAYAISHGKEPLVVVIDAGHGGHDVGAVDNGVKEKDINLGVALKLEAMLKKDLKDDIKVIMTRDDDTFISLQKRADIANHAKGNLFVSIHTNSVDKNNPNRKTVQGTSVYALGLHKDNDNMKVARRENSVIELEKDYKQKYSGFDPSKDESYIIFEMAQKKNLEQSLKFANEAQKQLVSHAERSNRGVKQAGFWVLWATSMPSVLVELDFICNPKMAKFMGSDDGQKKLAQALCNSIKSYLNISSRTDLQNSQKKSGVKELRQVEEEKKISVSPERRRTDSNSTKRRRRSIVGREKSKGNDVPTAEIPLNKGIEEFEAELAVEETTETTLQEENVEKKGDKKKKKEKKSKKKGKKETKENTKNYNSRRILVDGKGNVIEMQDIDKNGKVASEGRHISGKGSHKTRKEKIKTVYKIQILASNELLKQNNPRFCGLKPISSFKENDLYKYTVGESSDRNEIEDMLKEVKKKIPDAFIIVSTK